MALINLLLAVVSYIAPVHFEVSLAGNFGEPRPNHFHGGLDIKTQQQEGKAIYAIGDGYVSRIAYNMGDMGNAVFIRHPEGYTSVYAHLQRFAPQLQAMVKRHQGGCDTASVDIALRATDCPVARGQVIALSGNTGMSMGPHLHLQIQRTDDGHMLDPLQFLPGLLTDTVAPRPRAIMAYPQQGSGWFCGDSLPLRLDIGRHGLPDRPLTAWGRVGFAICADDFMQGSHNCLGVRFSSLKVDDVEVFASDVNDIPPADNPLVNLWGDIEVYEKSQEWFLRSFIIPGNTLSILKADSRQGIVDFSEERDYALKYTLTDFFGNTTEVAFIVRAVRDSLLTPPTDTAEIAQ